MIGLFGTSKSIDYKTNNITNTHPDLCLKGIWFQAMKNGSSLGASDSAMNGNPQCSLFGHLKTIF